MAQDVQDFVRQLGQFRSLTEVGRQDTDPYVKSLESYQKAVALFDSESFYDVAKAVLIFNDLHYGQETEDFIRKGVERLKRMYRETEALVQDQERRKKNIFPGDRIEMGRYPQTADGEYKPISWIVLKQLEDRMLLISEKGLDCLPYHDSYSDQATWLKSNLREWLNSEFKGIAFDLKEQKNILSTQLENPMNPESYISGGKKTTDELFVLSYKEFKELEKTALKPYLSCEATDFARGKGAELYSSVGFEPKPKGWHSPWWLRTPGQTEMNTSVVSASGRADLVGVSADSEGILVRPAFWCKI